jgi:hypothetical protein
MLSSSGSGETYFDINLTQAHQKAQLYVWVHSKAKVADI